MKTETTHANGITLMFSENDFGDHCTSRLILDTEVTTKEDRRKAIYDWAYDPTGTVLPGAEFCRKARVKRYGKLIIVEQERGYNI